MVYRWVAQAAHTGYAHSQVSCVVDLAAAGTIQIQGIQDQTTTVNCHTNAALNWVTIDRIL
jgi:hypothetical protein